MQIHLIKLCVGATSIDDLAEWQAGRLAAEGELIHVTRQTPRRTGFGPGASLYWVIAGFVRVRQRILSLREIVGEDGIPRCGLVLDPELFATEWQPRRPFQGWRYLLSDDAPRDADKATLHAANAIPPQMQNALRELRLI